MTGANGDPALTHADDGRTLEVLSPSRASDGGYLALSDLARVAADLDADYRIVGGHMVTLLVATYGAAHLVPLRETVDADFGALPQVIADPRLPEALRALDYTTSGASNRFVRQRDRADGAIELVIDILAPSYAGGLRSNQQYGALVVDEIPGLHVALARPAVPVDLRVQLLDGDQLGMRLLLPDLVSAVCIKALAYRGRFADKDAVDLWRIMNAAYEAGLRAEAWPTTATGRDAALVLGRFFGRPSGQGLRQACATAADQARMRALVRAVVRIPD